MTTFVLVPGAWLGGWCWKYVTPQLRAAGHEVYPVTPTGLGEREHLAGPDVDLETHITDVANVLAYEELEDVVLVGHSYAGLIVTEVANRLPDRLAHLVYLDGLVPPGDGPMSYNDIAGAGSDDAADPTHEVDVDDDLRVPMPEDPPGWVGISEADGKWLRSKAVAHPTKTFTQPVTVDASLADRVAHTYVLCTENGMGEDLLDLVRGMATGRDWDLHELATGHWPMASTPDAVVDRLESIADRT